METHRLRPSQSSIWLKCPGSIHLPVFEEEQTEDSASNLGTIQHQLLNLYLKSYYKPEQYLEPMQEPTRILALDLSEIKKQNPKRFSLEKTYKLPSTSISGTLDILYQFGSDVYIVDLKTGRIPVSPSCSQLKIYATLVASSRSFREIKNVTCVIFQNNKSLEEAILTNSVTYTAKYLRGEYRSFLKGYDSYLKSEESLNVLNTGEHCKYCKSQTYCDKFQQEVLSTPISLSSASQKLKRAKALKKYYENLEKVTRVSLENGSVIPNVSLKPGATKKVWKYEEESTVKALMNRGIDPKDAWNVELKNPKHFDVSIIEDLVEIKQNKPSLILDESEDDIDLFNDLNFF